MIKGTITLSGKTFDDFWYALEEAYKRIEGGNTSGHDHNEDSSFSFELSDNTEETAT